jgi:Kef-type K+ transport system membrane component KefB
MTQLNTLSSSASASRVWRAYAVMLALAAGLFFVIRQRGQSLVLAPASLGHVTLSRSVEARHLLVHILLALALITIVARVGGAFFQHWLGQPPVIGEIVAGLMLGPSLLGALAPGAYAFLLPELVTPHLATIARIGIVLFMFLVGLELDVHLLRNKPHAAILISHASILLPMILGGALALVVYPLYATAGVDFGMFAAFFGVSLSVTAFPVLARILTSRGMQNTELGVIALSCAAADDATAWCLLAIISRTGHANMLETARGIVLIIAFVFLMLAVIRPILRRFDEYVETRPGPISLSTQALVFAGLLLSAMLTEAMGIHALFGAFLFGAVMPHQGRLAAQLRLRLEDVVSVLLLPVFFTFSGCRTHLGLLSTFQDWAFCGLIILVATAGKFGGSAIAARVAGFHWREASAIGVLMNTRGLMELIVLNVGLDMGVISPRLFAMLLIMAVVTTFLTTPALSRILRADASRTPPLVSSAERPDVQPS